MGLVGRKALLHARMYEEAIVVDKLEGRLFHNMLFSAFNWNSEGGAWVAI